MRGRIHWKWLSGLSLAMAIAAVLFARGYWSPIAVERAPPIASPFENAQPDVAFVGAQRCAECHADQFQSFQQTAHHLAFGVVQPDAEPPDRAFEDTISDRSYRVYRKDGKFHHEETLVHADGSPLLAIDHAMKYVVGSGRYSKSYLFEQDGCLFESPATWYSEKQAWDLSPGYDHSNVGFQRPIDDRCLQCHVGRFEVLDQSPQRLAFPTTAIDCERCHGPGERHVAKWVLATADQLPHEQADLTIVHPGRLDRRRSEDVCMQCHLHSAATVERPGRRISDYRPGDRLEDYVVHYAPHDAGRQMEVTGHGEQMRLSRCYTETETLTCITCHNPHAKASEESRLDWYRARCLDCHAEQACGMPVHVRTQTSVADNCVECHMPESPTEIPHFAFTHHRIGIHQDDSAGDVDRRPTADLIAIDSPADVSEIEGTRNLGLALLQFSDTADGKKSAEYFQTRARKLLISVPSRRRDSEVAAALARLAWGRGDPKVTIEMAVEVERSPNASLEAIATANFTRGSTLYNANQRDAAIPFLEKAVHAHPSSDIWSMLSDCYARIGDSSRAVEAAKKAIELSPERPLYRQRYHELATNLGEPIDDETVSLIQQLRSYWERVASQ